MSQHRWYSFSLRRLLVAVAVMCISAVVARQYYTAKTRYELRALVKLYFMPFSSAAEVDSNALFARVNVSAPGVWFFSGSNRLFDVIGREKLTCDPGDHGVIYRSWCRNKAESERAKSDLFEEIEELLQRNQDMENYGYRVVVITHPPFGENTLEVLHDSLRPWPLGPRSADGTVDATSEVSD